MSPANRQSPPRREILQKHFVLGLRLGSYPFPPNEIAPFLLTPSFHCPSPRTPHHLKCKALGVHSPEMNRHRLARVALLLSGATAASAGTILNATTQFFYVGMLSLNDTGPCNVQPALSGPATLSQSCADSTGQVSYSVTAAPGLDPVASATANAIGPYPFGSSPFYDYAYGDVAITGYYMVLGDPSTIVPVDVFAIGWATASGSNAEASSSVLVTNGPNSTFAQTRVASGGFACDVAVVPTFILSTTLLVTPGELNEIQVSAGASDSTGAAQAFADPLLEIDPTFLANNPGYSLVFSPGLISPSTPEPAYWLLLASGLAGATVLRRRRSRPSGA